MGSNNPTVEQVTAHNWERSIKRALGMHQDSHRRDWRNLFFFFWGGGVRINGHLASKRPGSLLAPMGRYNNHSHRGKDFDAKCTFWLTNRNISQEDIDNNRNECLLTKNASMPLVPLCELDCLVSPARSDILLSSFNFIHGDINSFMHPVTVRL